METLYKINENHNLQAGSLAWVIMKSFDGGASFTFPSPNTEFLMPFIFVTISIEFVGLFVF